MGILGFLIGSEIAKRNKTKMQLMAEEKEKEFDRFMKTGECKYKINGRTVWMKPSNYKKKYLKK